MLIQFYSFIMNIHQTISLFSFILLFLVYYFKNKNIETNKWNQEIAILLQVCVVGFLGSFGLGYISNFICYGSSQLGERFYGSILFVSFLFIFYKRQDFDVINKITPYVAVGFVLIKFGCLISHPNCYGTKISFIIGAELKHPIPLYESLLQFFFWFGITRVRQTYHLGVNWLGFTALVAFMFEFLKENPLKENSPISLAQMVYVLVFLILCIVKNNLDKELKRQMNINY